MLAPVDTNTKKDETEGERKSQYKNIVKHEDMRRRRNECSVEIRKQRGNQMLMKRRNMCEDDDEVTESDSEAKPQVNPASKMNNAEVIKILSNNPNMEQMRSCFESIRRSLSKSKNPPVDEVIRDGLLPALVAALDVQDEKVQFEASWGLTNIVSGTSEQTQAAVAAGATGRLVQLCMHTSSAISEQALWAVANIAGDSAQLRDNVIQHSGVEMLMEVLKRVNQSDVSLVRTLAWAFSNMCRHKNPHAPLPVLEVLSRGLTTLLAYNDKQVRQDACWACSYLTDGPDEQISLARSCGVLPYIFGFLRESDSLVAPALRVLGNMATGSDDLTQTVVDLGTLNELTGLAERVQSSSVLKECCWLVSNVIAGTHSQIQAVLDANIMPLIISVIKGGDFKCQFEASWAVANLAQGGTGPQIFSLVEDDALSAICSLLNQTNVDMLSNALETILAILTIVSNQFPDRLDKVREVIEEEGGLDALEKLQAAESEKIYSLSYRIVIEFFSDEEAAEEDYSSAGRDENQPMYTF